MDLRAARLLVVVAALFVLSVVLKLNGSSIGVWRDVLRDDASPSALLYSTPKSVRADEWLAWTPSILSQAQHTPPFPIENANLGAKKSPLLMSVPVRHPAMFFRPQLYGFFLFDLETAFSFYWNVKVAALFLSFFFLVRALTRNDFWISLFGAGWIWFSAYTQWWFSCPPMMPEMLASWAVAVLCLICVFRPGEMLPKVVATLGLVIAGVNFTLCFYPPFQIPLLYLGLALLIGWFWQNKSESLQWRTGTISAIIAALAIAAVLVPYLYECKPTLELLAHTQYPGNRRTHGGELTIADAFNGVLGFFNTSERDYLSTRGNSCESSNFYPLWVFTIASSGIGLWRHRSERRIEVLLLGAILVFTLYIFSPFPEWLCRGTFLSYVTGTRMLLSVGIAGILFTTMLLARPIGLPGVSQRLIVATVVLSGIVMVVVASYSGNEKLLTPGRTALLLALNLLFVGLYYFAPKRIFCGVFLTSLVLNNGGINPLTTGLGPLLKASPATLVQQIRKDDPNGKWISYSNTWLPQFFKAQGVDVMNGLHIVPDPVFCRVLDPTGQYESIWNRYAFVVFQRPEGEGQPEFLAFNSSAYFLKISPLDSRLYTQGARYAVFPHKLDPPDEIGLHLLAGFPKAKMWIYGLSGSAQSEAGLAVQAPRLSGR